jgi:hypothetical protein
MRHPAFILAILLGAAAARALPILVTLEDSGQGGFGPLSFTFDMERQPPAPYDFAEAFDFSGDYIDKQDYYRINVADYFRVEMAGATGYGYNWLLEVYPRAFGIYEEYCEIRFFTSPGETLVLYGAWTTSWSEGTPIYASRYSGDQFVSFSDMHIAGIREADSPIIPEPGSLALFGMGIGAVAGAAGLRRKRRSAPVA